MDKLKRSRRIHSGQPLQQQIEQEIFGRTLPRRIQ